MINIFTDFIVKHIIKHPRHLQSLLHSTVVVCITEGASTFALFLISSCALFSIH